MLALLAGLLLALDAWRRGANARRRFVAVGGVTVLAAALVVTRHAALAFVPSAAIVIVGAATSGIVVHVVFEQGGTFPWFDSERGFADTGATMLRSLDRELLFFPFGLLACVAIGATATVPAVRRRVARWLHADETALRHADVVVFVLVALAAVLVMFLVVPVADPPRGRFVRFASLMLGGTGLVMVTSLPRAGSRLLLSCLLVSPVTVHAAKWVVAGRRGSDSVHADGGESCLPLHATLRRGVPAGTVVEPGLVVVDAPLFSWQQQRLGGTEPGSARNDAGTRER